MAWFNKEEKFDDSAAFETDNSGVYKVIIIVILAALVLITIGIIMYTTYDNSQNQTNQTNLNVSDITSSEDNNSEQITVNFTDFNITIDENPEGIYYYTTQERVVGEICFINSKRKPCTSLTNEVCAEEDCRKNVETVVECYVNHKIIDCPR